MLPRGGSAPPEPHGQTVWSRGVLQNEEMEPAEEAMPGRQKL